MTEPCDALVDILEKVDLATYINQVNADFEPKKQIGGTVQRVMQMQLGLFFIWLCIVFVVERGVTQIFISCVSVLLVNTALMVPTLYKFLQRCVRTIDYISSQ